MTHTPGPWEVSTYYSGSKLAGQWTRIEPRVVRESSFIRRDSYGGDEDECHHGIAISEADANLIAAAPDLLAALKYVWENGGKDSPDMRATVRAALTKAGEAPE